MKKIVKILEPISDKINWNDGKHGGWARWGFSYLYLKYFNFDADFETLSKIIKIDEQTNWYMGREELELNIFMFKAIKVILDISVS